MKFIISKISFSEKPLEFRAICICSSGFFVSEFFSNHNTSVFACSTISSNRHREIGIASAKVQ
jgi:hypothetical protein